MEFLAVTGQCDLLTFSHSTENVIQKWTNLSNLSHHQVQHNTQCTDHNAWYMVKHVLNILGLLNIFCHTLSLSSKQQLDREKKSFTNGVLIYSLFVTLLCSSWNYQISDRIQITTISWIPNLRFKNGNNWQERDTGKV